MLRGTIARLKAMHVFVGMRIFAAIVPISAPPLIVAEHGATVPVKAVITPAPRPEKSANRHAIAETDSAADIKSGTRGKKNDSRIVVRHDEIAGIYRHDGD